MGVAQEWSIGKGDQSVLALLTYNNFSQLYSSDAKELRAAVTDATGDAVNQRPDQHSIIQSDVKVKLIVRNALHEAHAFRGWWQCLDADSMQTAILIQT